MRPLGNGVRATAAMAATPTPLRLLTPCGIPQPPPSAAEILADCGIAGIRQSWARPPGMGAFARVPASERRRVGGSRLSIDREAGALQAGAREMGPAGATAPCSVADGGASRTPAEAPGC